MSRTYRIRLKECLSETININETWNSKVQILPLLSKEEMGDKNRKGRQGNQ